MNEITFKIITHNTPEYFELLQLREDVLRKPLGMHFTAEEQEIDKTKIQMAGLIDGHVVVTVALVPDGERCLLQRMAVHPDFQSLGLGSQILQFFDKEARARGFKEICENAAGVVKTGFECYANLI